MKKTIIIVLALVLALSMFASFAFVVSPGSGAGTENGLKIASFHATDDYAIEAGPRMYTALADTSTSPYAKNLLIRFAINFEVLNPLVASNNVKGFNAADDLLITSDTVDFSLSQYPGQIVLHKPYDANFPNTTNVIASTSTLKGGAYDPDDNSLAIKIVVDDTAGKTPYVSALDADGAVLGGEFLTLKSAKYVYSVVFSGWTKGEMTEKGLATLSVGNVSGTSFTAPNNAVMVTRGGRTYLVQKVAAADVLHANQTTNPNPTFYTQDSAGYAISVLTKTGTTTYTATPIMQLNTEVFKYQGLTAALNNKDVEGVGVSLGMQPLAFSAAGLTVDATGAITALPTITTATKTVMKTVLNGSTVYMYGNGSGFLTATEQAAFETMLADFGFGVGDGYSYKLIDANFTTASEYSRTMTAPYNLGKVVELEPEEEGDLDEGTEDDDLPDDGDIDEDDDDLDDIIDEDDEVPAETGDFSASIAIALAAAAIVAAAALSFVMKKARD